MPLQNKRMEDEMGKQFDDLFVIPDVIDKDKEKFLPKKDAQ
jgi:hypothetical protein